MLRPRNQIPTYRLHKQSGQAVVIVNLNGVRKDILLGKYGTPESKVEYERVIAELRVAGSTSLNVSTPSGPDLTVN